MTLKNANRWRKVQLHATIEPEIKERMKREAAEMGVSMSRYINICTRCFQERMETAREEAAGTPGGTLPNKTRSDS